MSWLVKSVFFSYMIELDLIRFVSSVFQRAAQEVTVAISVVFCMIYCFILWPCCVCACMRVRVLMFASCIFPPWLASPVCLIFSQMPRGFCQFVFVALASKLAHITFWLPALVCDSWSKELVLRICTTATVASCFLSVTHIRTPAGLNNKGLQTFFLKAAVLDRISYYSWKCFNQAADVVIPGPVCWLTAKALQWHAASRKHKLSFLLLWFAGQRRKVF